MLPDYAELLNFSVNDSSGKKVFEAELKNTNSGRLDLEWDGLDAQGNRLSDGSYKFVLTKVDGEKAISIPVKTSQIVQSVNWNKSKNEMQVEISDGRLLPMPDLDKIAY
jgi:flagellar hook assembly protein FlgD